MLATVEHSERDWKGEAERLRSLLTDSVSAVPVAWGLSRGEEAVFRAMLAHDVASPAIIIEATGSTRATLRVLVHRIRTKLAPKGIEIETLNGKGWRLLGREQWRAILAPHNEGVH